MNLTLNIDVSHAQVIGGAAFASAALTFLIAYSRRIRDFVYFVDWSRARRIRQIEEYLTRSRELGRDSEEFAAYLELRDALYFRHIFGIGGSPYYRKKIIALQQRVFPKLSLLQVLEAWPLLYDKEEVDHLVPNTRRATKMVFWANFLCLAVLLVGLFFLLLYGLLVSETHLLILFAVEAVLFGSAALAARGCIPYLAARSVAKALESQPAPGEEK